jgi:hypothetical protein
MLGHAVIHQKAVGCTEAKSDVDAHIFCAQKAISCANPPVSCDTLRKAYNSANLGLSLHHKEQKSIK